MCFICIAFVCVPGALRAPDAVPPCLRNVFHPFEDSCGIPENTVPPTLHNVFHPFWDSLSTSGAPCGLPEPPLCTTFSTHFEIPCRLPCDTELRNALPPTLRNVFHLFCDPLNLVGTPRDRYPLVCTAFSIHFGIPCRLPCGTKLWNRLPPTLRNVFHPFWWFPHLVCTPPNR